MKKILITAFFLSFSLLGMEKTADHTKRAVTTTADAESAAKKTRQSYSSKLKEEHQLWIAAMTGNCEKIEDYVRKGTNINKAFNYLKNPEAVNYIERWISFENEDATGFTALHMAALFRHPEAVKLLIRLGADANAQTGAGYTAAHFAALQGHTDIIQCLHDHGAHLKLKTKEGYTPAQLTLANHEGWFRESLAALVRLDSLGAGLSPKEAVHHELMRAVVTTGDKDTLLYFIGRNILYSNLGNIENTAIHDLLECWNADSLEKLRILIEAGYCINTANALRKRPLVLAAELELIDALQVLVTEGARLEGVLPTLEVIKATKRAKQSYARLEKCFSFINMYYYFQKCIMTQTQANTFFYCVCRDGFDIFAKKLVQDERIDPNATTCQTGTKNTPLHAAVVHGNHQVVRVLLNSPRVNTQLKNASGLTAEELAFRFRCNQKRKPVFMAFEEFKKSH